MPSLRRLRLCVSIILLGACATPAAAPPAAAGLFHGAEAGPVRTAGVATPAPLGPGPHSLAELVDSALANSGLLASLRARVDEREHAAAQARAWPNPSLELAAGRKEEAPVRGELLELGLRQALPLSGKPALRGEAIGAEAAAARTRLAAAEASVALDVVRLAYAYAGRRRMAELLEARMRHFELVHAYLSGRPFASPQQQAEALLARQKLRRVSAEAVAAEAELEAAFEALKLHLEFGPATGPGVMPEIVVDWLAPGTPLDAQDWLDRAAAGNPELAEQGFVLRGAELEIELARREAWPELELGLFQGRESAAGTESSIGMTLGLGLPLWTRNRSGLASARARLAAEQGLRVYLDRRLRSEVLRAIAELEAARAAAEQFPMALILDMAAAVEGTEEEFRKGRVDLLTFLELDEEAWETARSAIEAQIKLASGTADLLELAGERDPVRILERFKR